MPKQIGWSNESNLLYQISQQITRLINVTGTNSGGSITGSGTANYITRWTSSSSLNSSVIYQSSTGNIGIGTTTPSQKLDVNGSTRIVGNMSVGSNGNAIPDYINGIYALDGLSQFKQINVSNGCITFNEGTAAVCGFSSSPGGVLTDYITINTNSIERIRVLTNGNVGIGTTTPSQKLDINGNISANLVIAVNDFYGSNVRVNGYYANTITYMPFYSNASPYGEIMRMQNDGNVLIGTTISNGYKLQVNGNGWFNSDLYVRKPSNINCYIYVGDTTNSYSLLEFRQATNFYTIGTKPGGGFSFTNGLNNNDIFSLSSDATTTLSIAGGNNANFSGKVGVGGYSNVYTLPNMLTVIGNTSIGTTEALSTANASSALFSINSLTQGSIPLPKMTTAQIKAIASPVNGLMAYSTDDFVPCFYDSNVSLWKKLSHTNL